MTLTIDGLTKTSPLPVDAPVPLACVDEDPSLFFSEHPVELEQAKAICGRCPVVAQCLAGAVDRAEPHGVWGGQIFVDGQVVTHKRPRGRPRKSPPLAAQADGARRDGRAAA